MVVSDTVFPTITYHSKGHLIFLNDWKDPFYFSVAFPTLFFFDDDEYLGKRQQPVSIETWAK